MEKSRSAQASLKEGEIPLYTNSDCIRVGVILLYTILFVLSCYYAYKSYKIAAENQKKERYYIPPHWETRTGGRYDEIDYEVWVEGGYHTVKSGEGDWFYWKLYFLFGFIGPLTEVLYKSYRRSDYIKSRIYPYISAWYIAIALGIVIRTSILWILSISYKLFNGPYI